MIKRALCIGNAQYPDSPLKNPTNDSNDLAVKLEALGFEVTLCTDVNHRAMDESLTQFSLDLKESSVGLFFFAGHGMQIDGVNYLTATDTDFSTEINAKFSSLSLNKVIEVLEKGVNATSIIILDACRNNPYERQWRGSDSWGLAPVYAPKGTIIAYATSPGQTASDGSGRNGAFTSALLSHISHQRLTIEDLFKRVRNTLSLSTAGKQTSWEHTSLMGDFYFNPSFLTSDLITEYSSQALADSKFRAPIGSLLREIIEGLKSHSWGYQNSAMSQMASIQLQGCEKDDLFVLGRNIYQSACGTATKAEEFLSSLSPRLKRLSSETVFHLLNGILYEIYFDSNDRFREKKKSGKISDIFALEGDERFKASFEFIQQALLPYYKQLFYIPGTGVPVPLDVLLTSKSDTYYDVKRIVYDSQDIFYASDGVTLVADYDSEYPDRRSVGEFENELASNIAVPHNYLKMTYSVSVSASDRLLVPDSYKIQRLSTKPATG